MFSILVCAQSSESLACGCPKLPPFRPTCFGNSGLWFHDCGFSFSKVRYGMIETLECMADCLSFSHWCLLDNGSFLLSI